VTIVSTLTGSDGQPYTSTMRVVVRKAKTKRTSTKVGPVLAPWELGGVSWRGL
jgi:hypothetical protein